MTELLTQLLEGGINCLHETFILWDAEDRLVLCNERFREVNKAVADLLQPGTTYETFLRSGVERGCYPEAAGQEEAWIAARVRRHRNPSGLFEQKRQDGLWLLVDEQKMPDGGIVSIATDVTAQKLAEEALRQSETRFRQHATASSDWLWEIDAEKRYTYISEAMEDKVGRTPGQYLGMSVDQNIDELYDRTEWQPFLDAFEMRQPFRDLTVKRHDPDGTEQWIRTSGTPFYDNDGEFLGFRGSASDVTEFVKAEQELSANDQRYLELFNRAQVGLARTRISDGKLLEANDRLAEIYGYKDRDEIMAEVDPKERWVDPAARERMLAQGLSGGHCTEVEVQHTRKDGSVIWVRLSTSFFPELDYLETTNVDITEHKRAEAALAKSESQFRAVFDHAPTAIALKDSEGRYELVNRTYEMFFDSPADSVLGKRAAELYSPEIGAALENTDRRVLELGDISVFETKVNNADLPMDFVRITKFPVFDQSGAASGVGTFAVDISNEKAAEERLIQSQKMEAVGQLTGGVAHEFNNLLQVVSGNIEMLADDVLVDTDQYQRIQAIRRNVVRGSDLTSRLLSFSRRQPLAPKTLVIPEILAGMHELLGQTLIETIEVQVEQTDDIWQAEADPNQLENALLNLALNARDAMPDGGIITISASNIHVDSRMARRFEEVTPGDYVMLSVEDNGTGMTEDEISRAFEPFFTTKDIGKGTGLGLSMVYGFARQSGGFVEIDSTLGLGTAMRLYLPRITNADDVDVIGGMTATDEAPDDTALEGGTILLVEDDTDVRESLAAQLDTLGYQVIEAKDGVNALAVLAGGAQIDLLFTDVVMPGGLSGLELARQVSQLRPMLKVLFTTGYSEEALSDAGLLDDGAVVLHKPYTKAILANAISRVLD